ncbi:MAG TPA: hypothetical protein VLN90_05135, partial [Thioalkalivibrio sp.]|nr:hypothetical protein [Thioalkalivibrio sp.]
ACGQVAVHGIEASVPVYAREELAVGQTMTGPALVTEAVSTTWIAPGWSCEVDKVGNLALKYEG